MPSRIPLISLMLFPALAGAQAPAIRFAETGAAPGFVLRSWTARDGLPVNATSQIIQSRSGYIWLATFDGLVRFDGARFATFNTGNSEGLPSNRIVDVIEDDDGTLVLTTELNQRVRFDGHRFTLLGGEAPDALPAGPVVRRVSVGPDGSRWTATGGEIHVDGRIAYRAPRDGGFAMGIISIAADMEGSLWFSTTAGGLHQLKPALFNVYTISDTRGLNNLYSVAASSMGGVWAGGWAGGISRIEGNGRAMHLGAGHNVPAGVVSIFEDSRRRLWLGEIPCELPVVRCARMPSTPFSDLTYAHHEEPDGTLWFGTAAGLFRLRNAVWDKPAGAHVPRRLVRAFLRTVDSALWMATNGGGLARYLNGSFVSITTAHGLPSNLIRALYQDPDGWLWAGTEGMGLARLDPREWTTPHSKGHIANVRASDGLFDDGVHAIVRDASDRLWMSSNRGIFRVDRAELNAVADGRAARVRSIGYTENHGLRNREANGGSQPAAARSRDGRLWFATQEGLAVVDPGRVGGTAARPNVLVERIIAGGVAIPDLGEIEIPPARRDLRIEYTALTFLEPENVRFRYRLAPYDMDWVDAESRRSAQYTRVPPGRYSFEIMASVGGGEWIPAVSPVDLRVVPRFFETRTFAVLILLFLAAVAWVAVRWRIARLRSLAVELQQRVDDRTRALRERETLLESQNARLATQADQLQELDRAKTRFFANVSHELRTPLTLTIGPLEDARVELAAAANSHAVSRIDMALRNARRLFRLVNQILDVSRLDAGGTQLRARRGDIAAFVRGIASAFDGVAARKNINFQVDASRAREVWFDPDALEKVLANLLSNAFKFTPANGGVLVAISGDERLVRIRVSDSGPGIPADHVPYIFDRFYQVDETNTRAQPGTGIGLSLARELAELHGGTIDVESGPGGGATFTLSLRHGRLHLRDDQIVAEALTEFEPPKLHELDVETASDADHPAHEARGIEVFMEDVATLLVVDDSADLRTYVRARLEPRYRVVEAADGADAIRRARELIPDLIISDVMMPGTDGHALCSALRESPETDFIPVILLTAQAEPEQRIEGLGRGADDYIVKPFDMRELDARVDNLISSRRRLRERFAGKRVRLETVQGGLSDADRTFVERLKAAVETHLADPDFGVSELAAAVFQDRSHLFRRTRELLGETPSDLLRRLRLERATELLNGEDGSIAEVAYGAGFNSVSHFCRAFRAHYGMTPSDYRQRSEVRL